MEEEEDGCHFASWVRRTHDASCFHVDSMSCNQDRSHLQSVSVNIPVNINLKPMGNVLPGKQKTWVVSPEDNRT